jgi:hypothetical protein
MLRFDMGMGQNQHWLIQDHQQQLCPTSMVEHQNPTTPYGVNIDMLMPPSTQTFSLVMHKYNPNNNIDSING